MFLQFLFYTTVFLGAAIALPAKVPVGVDGYERLMEGDMAGVPQQTLSKLTNGAPWPSGIVPYAISPKFGHVANQAIMDAIATLNNTCVKFLPRSTEKDFIQIEPSDQSFSYVGRIGGNQTVGLVNYDRLSKGSVLHRLMHALGFYHEQTRIDRDDFIDINWSNIAEADKVYFQKYVDPTALGQRYDFSSIMHYGEKLFAIDANEWTMRPKTEYNIVEIGSKQELSTVDIRKIKMFYNCTDVEPDVHAAETVSTQLNSTSTSQTDITAETVTNSVFHVDSDPDVQDSSSIYVLKPGKSLHINDTIWSRSKNIRVTLQESGNLVIFMADDCGVHDRAIWASVVYHFMGAFDSKRGPTVAQLQPDGNFVIHNSNDSTVRWSSKTNGSYFSGASLKLNDDGKMVIYKDGKALWQSGGHTFCLPLSTSPFHDAQVLLKSGEQLRPGRTITSINGKTRLEFRSTGDLVVIRTCDGAVHWNSQTDGMPVSILKMQTNGNLVIYNGVPAEVWATASNEDSCQGCADLRLSGGTLCTYRYGSCTWTSSSMEEDCPWNLDDANSVHKKPS